ncbi:MAG: TonB family protein [Sphaerochaetaceae bacterium]
MSNLGKIVLSIFVIALAVSSLFIPLPKEVLEDVPIPQSIRATLFFEEENITIDEENTEGEEPLEEQPFHERELKPVPVLKSIPLVQTLLVPFRIPPKPETKNSFIPLEQYIEVDEATQPPRFDYEVLKERIKYPIVAKRQNREGRAMVRLYIATDGKIVKAIIEQESSSDFGQAALNAFSELTVEPALLKGVPVAVTLLFPINFTLN